MHFAVTYVIYKDGKIRTFVKYIKYSVCIRENKRYCAVEELNSFSELMEQDSSLVKNMFPNMH